MDTSNGSSRWIAAGLWTLLLTTACGGGESPAEDSGTGATEAATSGGPAMGGTGASPSGQGTGAGSPAPGGLSSGGTSVGTADPGTGGAATAGGGGGSGGAPAPATGGGTGGATSAAGGTSPGGTSTGGVGAGSGTSGGAGPSGGESGQSPGGGAMTTGGVAGAPLAEGGTSGTGRSESSCVPGVDTGDACDPAVDTEICARSTRDCACGTDGLWACTATAGAGGSGAAGGSGGTDATTGGDAGEAGQPGTGGTGGDSSPGGSGGGLVTGGAGGGGGEAGGGGTGGGGTGGQTAEGPCTVGAWPTADPTQPGPFATTTETGVGPAQSDGTRFTLVRPTDLEQTALCHPIVTWGNGSGANPTFYSRLLEHLASHGFIAIASESGDVQQGNPYYQIAGALWVAEQGEDPASPMYQRVDGSHIGATGHSKGGFATSEVGTDSRITTTAPACGAIGSSAMQGPTLILCGGQDPYVQCGNEPTGAYNGTSGVPTMLANSLGADHGNWFMGGSSVSDMEAAITAWMRVHLMEDTGLRDWFYGPSCQLCDDSAWSVQRKMMD